MTTTGPTTVLRDVEWISPADYSPDYCQACDSDRTDGHAPDCTLAAALKADPTAQIAKLRADAQRLTRERDDALADNAQLRAAIVAWNDYNEATSGHTIAERAYDESESDERRSFWTDAILTQSSKWAAAMKRLDAMGAWRGSPTWKY